MTHIYLRSRLEKCFGASETRSRRVAASGVGYGQLPAFCRSGPDPEARGGIDPAGRGTPATSGARRTGWAAAPAALLVLALGCGGDRSPSTIPSPTAPPPAAPASAGSEGSPESRSSEPGSTGAAEAGTVAYSLASAPPQGTAGETALEGGTPAEGGEGSVSRLATASTADPPAVPGKVGAAARSSSEIRITWAAVSGATGYTVRRRDDEAERSTDATQLDWPELSAATEYCFAVRATNAGGASEWSSPDTCATTEAKETRQEVPCDRVGSATISAQALDHQSIRVRWGYSTEPECEQHATFTVSRGTTRLTPDNADDTTLVDTGLNADTWYSYTVSASTFYGSFEATTRERTPPQPLDTPSVTASALGTTITVNWGPVTDATGYRVWRNQNGGAYIEQPSTTTTSITQTGLEPGQRYCYEVAATGSRPESERAAEKCATTTRLKLPTPTGLTVRASDRTIDVGWNAVPNADSYEVQRKKGSGSYSSRPSTSGTSFEETLLDAGTRYCYQVVATAPGYMASAAAEGCDTTSPPTPTGVGATAESSSSILIDWTASKGATGYTVRRDGSATKSDGSPPYVWRDLDSATRYCFEVRASNGAGSSSWSSEDCAKTSIDPPTRFGKSGATTTTISLSWRKAHGVTVYKIRHKRMDLSSWSGWDDTDADDRHTVTGLQADTWYDFEIRSEKNSERSAAVSHSAQTDAVPPPVNCTAPEIPAGLSLSRSGSTITVSWDPVDLPANCTSLRYHVSRDSMKIETTTSTSYDDSVLSVGRYCYQVSAESDGSHDSGKSACEYGTVPPPPPGQLATPEGLEVSAEGLTVSVSWDSVTEATGYRVWRKAGDGSYGTAPHATPTSASLEETRLTAGTEYCYRVSATGSRPESDRAEEMCATTAPPAPTGVGAAEQSSSAIRIRWDGASEATGYTVRRRDNMAMLDTANTHLDWTGLNAETEYCFEVKATNDAGSSSWSSPEKCATTEVGPPPAAPGTPENVEAAARSSSAIRISWDSVSEAAGYTVRRRDNMAMLDTVNTHLDWTGLSAETEHCFEVKATNAGGPSAWSSPEVCATTDAPPVTPTPPDPPDNFTAEAASSTSVDLSWDAVTDADSYEVRYREADGMWEDWSDVGDVTSHPVTGLDAETEYAFEVRAVEGTLKSSAASASATTPAPPVVPGDFAAEAASSSAIELSWDEVDDATGYRLRRRFGSAASWSAEFTPDSDDAHRDTGLSADTEYCYGVRAVVGSTVEWSGDVCARTKRLAPTGLRATRVSRTGVDMVWDPQPGVSTYWVYGLDRALPRSGAELQLTGLEAGETYEFQVVSRINNVESERSGVLTVTTPNPMGPAGLETETGPTAVTLSWEAGSGAGSWSGPGGSGRQELTYKVDRRSPAGTGDFALLAETLTGLSYEDTGLTPETEYEYRVRTTVEISGFTLHSRSPSTLTVRTPRPAPQNLVAAAASSVSVGLSWDAVPGAAGYEFRWSPDGTTWGDPESAGTGTSHEHPDLNPQTRYHYEVRVAAMVGMDDPPWSDPDDATTEALGTPTGLAVDMVMSSSVELSWDAVPAAGSYELERTASGGSPEELAVSGTSRADTGLMAKTGYSYRVRSVLVRDQETFYSDWSMAVTATTGAAQVQNLVAAAASSVSVGLSWDAVPGAAGYEFRWSPDGTTWSDPESAGTGTSHEHPDLNPQTRYHYEVRVAPMAGMADPPWSDPDDTTTEALGTPTGLAVDMVMSSSVELSWDAVPAAGSYELERTASGGSPEEFAVSGTSRADTGLMAKTGYSYRVRSVLTRGTDTFRSEWSTSVTATTGAAQVQNLVAASSSSVSVALSWDAVPGAAGYEFRWSPDGTTWSDPESAGTGTSHEHPDLNPQTTYHYEVRVAPMAGMADPPWSDADDATTEALEVPQNLEAEADSATAVMLSWDAVSAADSYDVERMLMSSKRSALIRGIQSGYLDSEGVTAETEYEYRVQSVRVREEMRWESAWSGWAAVTTPAMMVPVPENLSATAASSVSVELSWNAVTGADRYEFRWKEDDETWQDDATEVDVGAETTHTHGDRNPATDYEYQVRAFIGTRMSEWSEAEEVETRALEVPENLSPVADSATAVTLTWDTVAAADSYDVERMEMSSRRNALNRGVQSGYVDDEGVTAETEYEYRVQSVRTRDGTRWDSAWSTWESVTTPAVMVVAPEVETEAATAFSVELSWEAVPGAGGYRIRRRKTGETDTTEFPVPLTTDGGGNPVPATSYVDGDLDPETTYAYQVGSVSGSEQVWSAEVEETTPAFAVPGNFEATATGADSVELSWDAVPGDGVRYRVRRRVSGTRRWTTEEVDGSPVPVADLEPLQEYEFRIFAVRRSSGGTLHRSGAEDTEATTLAPDPPALDVDEMSSSSVELSWSSVTGATGYELQRRSPSGTGSWATVYGPGSATSYEDEAVSAATGYGYRVRAVVSDRGESAWGREEVAVTPSQAPPATFRRSWRRRPSPPPRSGSPGPPWTAPTSTCSSGAPARRTG